MKLEFGASELGLQNSALFWGRSPGGSCCRWLGGRKAFELCKCSRYRRGRLLWVCEGAVWGLGGAGRGKAGCISGRVICFLWNRFRCGPVHQELHIFAGLVNYCILLLCSLRMFCSSLLRPYPFWFRLCSFGLSPFRSNRECLWWCLWCLEMIFGGLIEWTWFSFA